MKHNKKYTEIMKQLNYKPIGSVLLRLCGVMRSNFSKTWNIWCSVWGIIGVIYWLNKLINYYA